MNTINNNKGDTDSKKSRAITEDSIHNFNDFLSTSNGPNSNTQLKLEQLTIHQNLHNAYQNNELPWDMLGYYLSYFEKERLSMIESINNGTLIFLPIGIRLKNIPPSWIVLADRGFAFDATKYPNLNPHITPHFIQGRNRFTQEELEEDLVCCMLRYVSEAHYSNIIQTTSLQDVIPWD